MAPLILNESAAMPAMPPSPWSLSWRREVDGAVLWTQPAPQHGAADASGCELCLIILEPGSVVMTAGGLVAGQELQDTWKKEWGGALVLCYLSCVAMCEAKWQWDPPREKHLFRYGGWWFHQWILWIRAFGLVFFFIIWFQKYLCRLQRLKNCGIMLDLSVATLPAILHQALRRKYGCNSMLVDSHLFEDSFKIIRYRFMNCIVKHTRLK